MLPVADARAKILDRFAPLPLETVSLAEGTGRVLAEALVSRRTQPASDVSAMDGYAVRGEDVAQAPVTLRQIGTAPAGHSFDGTVGPGETVRIFTGAPVPAGADTVVMQENTKAEGERITINQAAKAGAFVRPAGLDFAEGQSLLDAGVRLGARELGLAAAMNRPWLSVHRRPVVALLATGDEVVMPGDPVGRDQLVSSNTHALAAFVTAMGGLPRNLGIAPDRPEALHRMVAGAAGADLLVTTGGVSVGQHDIVADALGEVGFELDFWKIAMRPGKPLMFGRWRDVPLLGLPGNPVSTVVCAVLFLGPILERLLGLPAGSPHAVPAELGRDLPANDQREDYMRSGLERRADGALVAMPFDRQDSSMMATLARADALAIRPPNAPPARAGDPIDVIPLDGI